jgi:hypothetical protein
MNGCVPAKVLFFDTDGREDCSPLTQSHLTVPSREATRLIGKRLAHFQILEKLGHGGNRIIR